MKNLLARMKKKAGPLPLWAWATVAGGAGWYFMRRGKSSTAADQVAAGGDTLPGSADAYGGSDTSPGSLGGGAGAIAPVDPAGGAELGDLGLQEGIDKAKGQLTDFTDWIDQTASTRDATTAPPTPGAEAVDPTTTATAKLPPKPPAKGRARGRPKWIPARGGERGHWALPNGSWTTAPKGAKPKPAKPKTPKPTKPKRPNRVTALLGKGKAGARARPPAQPKPPPPRARPRGIAKKTTAAKPKPKPKPRRFLPKGGR
jgi:hypothetical protein